jgi:mRNA interferase MazF
LIWRGEVYYVDLGQPVGHEPAFRRPAVVVSVVVPITTTSYGLRSHVELASDASGLDHTSFARCDQLRVVSVERLSSRQGMIGPDQIRTIDQALRFVLDL